MQFDATAFGFGWAGIMVLTAFFLPHEYHDKSKDVHDAMLRRGKPEKDARYPYRVLRRIRYFSVVSGVIALVDWVMVEGAGIFSTVDISPYAFITALVALSIFAASGYYIFVFEELVKDWVEELVVKRKAKSDSASSPTSEKSHEEDDNHHNE
ncbi:MAG: hypothetical protein HY247_03715 [archaeon]|nr:MAG: hypothetical protein HY247_03715 [archaeon]